MFIVSHYFSYHYHREMHDLLGGEKMANKERNKIIASHIKKLIKEKGMTQKQLAVAIDISPTTLSDYMNFRSIPSHGVIQKMADYFKVSKCDIDTTYKEVEETHILTVYNQLNKSRQQEVYRYATKQLNEQNNTIPF